MTRLVQKQAERGCDVEDPPHLNTNCANENSEQDNQVCRELVSHVSESNKKRSFQS